MITAGVKIPRYVLPGEIGQWNDDVELKIN